jgi:ABC-type uncharacterized transport system auxiliary subunit
MNANRSALLLIAASLLSTGCFGSKPQTEYYYYLTGPTAIRSKKIKGPSVAVGDFTAGPGYSRQGIAYREQENELRYYAYRRWVSSPSQMLAKMVTLHLRASKQFSQVDLADHVKEPLARLEANIEALEELDLKSKTYARLAMTFVLRDASSERILFQYSFDKRYPCTRRHPREVAHGVSKLLAIEVGKLALKIADALK